MAPTPRKKDPSTAALRRVQLLASLSDSALAQLSTRIAWRQLRRGQQVVSRDSTDKDVYFVVEGRVRVLAFSEAGRQVTYDDIGPGGLFGDFAALDGLARSADVIALEDTLTASIPPSSFRRLLREHPEACESMMLRLVGSVRDLTERLFELSTLGLQNRVHAEILRIARAAGVVNGRAVIAPAPRHADIANCISANREQVTREISAMRRRGLIESSAGAMIVPDVERIEHLVRNVRSGT